MITKTFLYQEKTTVLPGYDGRIYFDAQDIVTENVYGVEDLPETIALHYNIECPESYVTLTRYMFVRLLESMVGYERKIDAIKLLRCYTSWGLKECKDFVESL
jgi:ribosomal protein L7/L12